jgi:pSer/pThr/pTyr-binding forkhead associated (FHA) protein
MKARLIERGESSEQTREISLGQSEFLIGRGADCDLRLRVSSISRHHCLIRLGSDDATLVDLGSSNGTFVNGKRVRSQANLASGDELLIGSCRFLIELGDEARIDLDTGVGADPFTSTLKLRPPGYLEKQASAAAKPAPPKGPGGTSTP